MPGPGTLIWGIVGTGAIGEALAGALAPLPGSRAMGLEYEQKSPSRLGRRRGTRLNRQRFGRSRETTFPARERGFCRVKATSQV